MKKTVEELIDMYEAGKLHTDMSTQRGFIYNSVCPDGEPTITKAGAVIRSILQDNIQLPAMYFWNVQDPETGISFSSDEFNLTDGKQRFLSLYHFMKDHSVVTKINNVETAWGNLSQSDKDKLLDYTFEITTVTGTTAQEEKTFKAINSFQEPLTMYERLRGAYYGTYLVEFEDYVNQAAKRYDSISEVNRGSQAVWLLSMAAGTIDVPKDFQEDKLGEFLRLNRGCSFDPTFMQFDKKVNLVVNLSAVGVTTNNNISKTGQKVCQIANYVINCGYDTKLVLDYYREGFGKDNDIPRWSFAYEHVNAIDGLCSEPSIRCDFVRNVPTDAKVTMYRTSNKCCMCGEVTKFSDIDAHHKLPWKSGGRTTFDNTQLLCHKCHPKKEKELRESK